MIYLIASAIFIGLILFLVIGLTVFQAIFFDEKKVNIVVNKSRDLPVETGVTLLSALADKNIFIPSACGGKGSCGVCRVQIDRGAGDPLPQELPYLSRRERKQGIRLSCQVKINGPLEITIPGSLLNVKKYRAVVVGSKAISDDIVELGFRLIEPGFIDLRAGCYIQLIVPEYYEEFRAYSVSNSPVERGRVEIMVKLLKNGLCSTYAHALEKGDIVHFTGPYGEFDLDHNEETELILVGGGVGMAPMKNIVLYCLEKLKGKKLTFFFGCRAQRDMIYYDFFKELESRHSNLKVYYALSEMEPGDRWDGEKGFIHLTLEKYMNPTGKRQAFLCGPPPMIHAVTKVLKSRGFEDRDIFWDDFGIQ